MFPWFRKLKHSNIQSLYDCTRLVLLSFWQISHTCSSSTDQLGRVFTCSSSHSLLCCPVYTKYCSLVLIPVLGKGSRITKLPTITHKRCGSSCFYFESQHIKWTSHMSLVIQGLVCHWSHGFQQTEAGLHLTCPFSYSIHVSKPHLKCPITLYAH